MMSRASQRGGPTTIAICAALALAVVGLYGQTARFQFVALDDLFVIVNRPEINHGLSAGGVRWAFTTIQPDWQPLTWLSHMLTFTLAGAAPGPHHLVNVGLHALNSVLLFLALRLLTGARWPSALAAALFALHPLRAESVAWVVERKDTLSGLFWMLALLAYGWYARRPSAGRYAAVLLACGFGLMSKAMLVTLPAVLLLLDGWPLRRWRGAGAPGGRSLLQLLIEKLPLFVLVAGVAAVTVATASGSRGLKSLDAFPLAWRLVMPPLAYAAYLAQSAWPTGMAAMYPHPALIATPLATVAWRAAAATVLLLAITVLCLRGWRARPYLAVGWGWFLLTLLPVIGVVQVGAQWHADRFTYIPTIGLAIMLAWGLRDLVAARPRLRVPVAGAAVLALLALSAASWRQIATWRDSVTLFEHAIAATPDNYFAHQVLAAQLRAAGDLDGARRHLEEALRIRPDEAYAHEQLGLLYEQQRDPARAAAAFEQALRLRPDSSWISRRRLTAIRLAEGRLDDAVALLEGPDGAQAANAQMRFALGTALLNHGRAADAVTQMRAAVALAPDAAGAHNGLGVALAAAGRPAEAAAEFERTLALQADFPMAAARLDAARRQSGSP